MGTRVGGGNSSNTNKEGGQKVFRAGLMNNANVTDATDVNGTKPNGSSARPDRGGRARRNGNS